MSVHFLFIESLKLVVVAFTVAAIVLLAVGVA